MVMVLMNLPVDGSGGLLMTVFDDLLIHHGGSDLFMDSGLMISCLVPSIDEGGQ